MLPATRAAPKIVTHWSCILADAAMAEGHCATILVACHFQSPVYLTNNCDQFFFSDSPHRCRCPPVADKFACVLRVFWRWGLLDSDLLVNILRMI